MWFSDTATTFGQTDAQLHGCGGSATDPYWLLLPGERRFDSFEITVPATTDYELDVDVEITEKRIGSATIIATQMLSWKGRLTAAVATGERLRTGRLE
jgi:hypothetical protein